ncbi:MAG: NUDIX domain-containing protein [Myxococcota bacterium]|nr:NUDIX domain-containing protein [Myxococcota bacterium]
MRRAAPKGKGATMDTERPATMITLLPIPEQIAKPILAATVILLRDSEQGPESFLMRRSMKSRFMPGAYVFPGGKVDPTDASLAPEARSPAFLVAAVREAFEEAGVLLAVDENGEYPRLDDDVDYWQEQRRRCLAEPESFARLLADKGLRIATDLVRPWSWWLTPTIESRRFDTRFFIARLPQGQQPLHDGHETTDSLWMPVGQCLNGYQGGSINMAPPTMATMVEMSAFPSADALMAAAPYDRALRFPFFGHDEQGRQVLLLAGDPEYPADTPAVRGPTRVMLKNGRWWVVE